MLQQLLKENQDLKDRLDTIKESSEKVIKSIENLQSKSNSDIDMMYFADWCRNGLTNLEYSVDKLEEHLAYWKKFKKEKKL